MEMEATQMTFWVALQASIVLGLLHGISPCGHSWPILATFCLTATSIQRCVTIWFLFCLGITGDCRPRERQKEGECSTGKSEKNLTPQNPRSENASNPLVESAVCLPRLTPS